MVAGGHRELRVGMHIRVQREGQGRRRGKVGGYGVAAITVSSPPSVSQTRTPLSPRVLVAWLSCRRTMATPRSRNASPLVSGALLADHAQPSFARHYARTMSARYDNVTVGILFETGRTLSSARPSPGGDARRNRRRSSDVCTATLSSPTGAPTGPGLVRNGPRGC